MSQTAPRRGFVDILSSIAQNTADLTSAEARLARDEAIDHGKETISGGIMTLLAGVLAIPTLIFLGLALSTGLAPSIGPIAANLVTAVLFALVALGLYGYGRSKIGGSGETMGRTKGQFRQDRETLRENLANDH